MGTDPGGAGYDTMTRVPEKSSLKRTAFSLVEMLVALVLLTALVLVAVSWMTMIVGRQDRDQQRASWARASSMILDQVGRDLMQADSIEESRHRTPRVRLSDGQLSIRTLDRSEPAGVRYEFDPGSRSVLRVGAGQDAGNAAVPPLIGDVGAWEAEITMPDGRHTLAVLRVTIRSTGGLQRTRDYTLSEQDVRP